MVIVVMGVAGAGKTTVGRRLADELGWTFVDADDLHAPESVERMRRGEPLGDEHRAPWLAFMAQLIADHAGRSRPLVLACSALSRSHRAALLQRVRPDDDVRLVHLHADNDVIRGRLAGRSGHFFPPALFDTQLTTLERPDDDAGVTLLTVDAARPVDDIVATIRRSFGL